MQMKTIAVLSNVTTGILEAELSAQYQVYAPSGYDTWRAEMLDEASELNREGRDLGVFLFYGDAWRDNWKKLEDGTRFIAELECDLRSFLMRGRLKVAVISTLDFREEQVDDLLEGENRPLEWQVCWQRMLMRLRVDFENVHVYDWCKSIREMGAAKFYARKMWYTGSMPFSLQGMRRIAEDIDMCVRGILKERKKCVVLDLDNTLWGGVAGEGSASIDDHNQGRIYWDFQRQLKQAKEQGVILAILSKNNFADVEALLTGGVQMPLRLEDFAGYRIDWEEKYENIRLLAQELNIGLDSMVFIDDNPAEREAMKQFNPEVIVPDFPQDVTALSEWFYGIYRKYFFCTAVTSEDVHKTEMYHQECKRKEVREGSSSLLDYLAKLEIEVDMHRMREAEIPRVSQLCMKTNQFNLTTKRYAEDEVREMYTDPNYDIFSVHTWDKFGDNGLVSVVICRHAEDTVEIDTFLMSCRVMGRKIEDGIVQKLIEYYGQSFNYLKGQYIETPKNQPVKDLYARMSFRTMDNGCFVFSLKNDVAVQAPLCFKRITFSTEEANEG